MIAKTMMVHRTLVSSDVSSNVEGRCYHGTHHMIHTEMVPSTITRYTWYTYKKTLLFSVQKWLNLYTTIFGFVTPRIRTAWPRVQIIACRFGCYKGGIHWLAMRSPPKQPNSNILLVLSPLRWATSCYCILRLRARWFALPNRREGKTLRFVSPPFIPCVIWPKPTQSP